MAWRIEYAHSVRKSVEQLDPPVRRRIRDYLENKVAATENPRRLGKPLKGELSGLWRYRIGDFRVACELQDQTLVVLVFRTGHPKEVYD
ncbi:MAG: type II toxin-antitoxin system RelE/ParE family toxin [Gammaproteobacteria bacterium]|nr:type II toxin-antitoxin system RelE/ParE family toxin [Gammaproteobacteria bacterium]NIT63293.1 type II toxin-antitoxin system RelE/ParE family toxin [Gammaproteobacteria bacterium]NIV20222.1 type II toxin-antitoxin system mRNA interferase toxin, RelE/StbE family [Gammaproteobacteria bacterium]NIY31873.1 type II toxin-antitoxin system mRNA interferase toxin, RelE/StbE family [Gammaproteobacteria bacterium]